MKFEKLNEGRFRLDVKGYVCPHPQIYTKKALSKVSAGDIIEVLFDNPSSGESISNMCEQTGDEIVRRNQDAGQFSWDIEKA